MEMTQEMMGDTLDSALDDETTEDDAAELVGQVGTWLCTANPAVQVLVMQYRMRLRNCTHLHVKY